MKLVLYRIQAQLLQFPSVRIIWINAYFPTDPQLINYDDNELQQILNQVESIMDNSEFDEVIFGADFKWDKSRNTGFASCIELWVNRVGLLDVWDTFPADYTHVHGTLYTLTIGLSVLLTGSVLAQGFCLTFLMLDLYI